MCGNSFRGDRSSDSRSANEASIRLVRTDRYIGGSCLYREQGLEQYQGWFQNEECEWLDSLPRARREYDVKQRFPHEPRHEPGLPPDDLR